MASADEDKRACQMLSDLHAACLAANTDKSAERKKQIGQIKVELTKSQVIGALNYSSESNASKRQMLSWQRLFMMVKEIFVRDVKTLLVAKDRQQSSYQKLQQEALCLVKTIVKLACRGTDVKLKPGVVIQLLMELLEDDSGCEMFGVEFTNIVLRDMLSKRQYWYHLDKKLSHSLLSHYYRIFSVASSVRFDRSILSKSLHIILFNMVQHHDISCEDLFSTLMQYFSGQSVQDDSLMVTEHMVCSTSIACHAVAIDQRINVCKLGEAVFLPLLTIWKKKKPSEKLKDELVKFYQLQMALHHPHGSRQGTDAAFAVDWCTWKRNLLQLYDAVYQELDEMKCRSRFSSSNSKDATQYQLKDNLLQLAADLCHQLLGDGGSVAELTQISQCSGTQHGNAAKRRRIETGWMLILEKIMTSANALHSIPWLQLVTVILQKYPDSVSIDEQLSLLPSLQQLLADCRNVDVSGWLLRCLLSFTNAFVCDPLTRSDEPSGQLLAIWHRVCASAKRFLNIRHLQDDALNLFTCLMKKKIYFPDNDMWTLFRPGGIALSNSSVLFLTTYISLHGVPGSYCPDVNRQPGSSFRLCLLEWMFPEIDPDTDWSVVDRSKITDASCLASSAVALSIRDAQTMITQELPFEDSARVNDRWLDVQWCLRAMSFDISVSSPTTASQTKRRAVVATPSVLQHIARRILELLRRDISYHLENSSPELKMLESVAYQCCLSSKILNSVQRFWTTDFSEIQTLVNELKNLMTSFTDSLTKFIQTSGGITQLSTIVQMLREMVTKAPNEADDAKSDLSDVCQTIVPDRLIQLLLGQMSDPKIRLRGSAADSDDIFAGTSTTMDIDGDFDMSVSQASSESMMDVNTNASDSLSAFSSMLLSDKEKLRLLIIDFLCCWSQRASSGTERNLNLHPDKESMMKTLVGFVDEEKSDWSVKEPYHLQLLQHIVCGLTSDVSSLPDVILENLVDSLRLVCKHCISDQDACCAIVDMLGRLVPHMRWHSANKEVSESLTQSRKITVQMHGLFWKRAAEGLYCGRTKLAIVKALINFIECDPENVWTTWAFRDENKEMRTELPRLLQDPHLCVRLLAASAVPRYAHLIFVVLCLKSFFGKTVNEKYCPSSREVQNQVFEEVIESLQQLLNTQGASGSAKFLRYTFQTAVCSTVQVLNGVIRSSEACRKRATFVLLQMTKDRHFDINLVKKMLCQTAIHLRYSDLRSFFEDHLPCLLKYWIENSYDFQDFPCQLLDYDSPTAFCRIHFKTIVTQLMTDLKLESLDEISSLLGMDRRSLLECCLPSIVIHILPLFAANKAIQNGIQITDGYIKKRLPHAVQCYDVLVKELGQQLVEKSILENMKLIVVGVLMSLHETNRNNDDATSFAYFSDSDPEPNPPTFSTSVIMTTLDYIKQSHSANASSIVNLLAQWQDGIQKVLLSLLTHFSKAHTTNEKCRILSIYFVFVRLLLKDFPDQLGGCWAFVLRDIIYTSLHCIQQQLSTRSSMDLWNDRSVDLLVICCDLLKMTLEQTIRVCHEEIQKYLAFIIGSIGPLVGLREDLNTKCEEIINIIYVENSDQLQNILPRLDPLPRSSIFQRANDVYDKMKSNEDSELKEEIEQFLQVGHFYSKTVVFGACNIRMEGLRHVSSQLVTRRQELARLVPTSDEAINLLLQPKINMMTGMLTCPTEDPPICTQFAVGYYLYTDSRPSDTLCRLVKDLVRMVSHTDHTSNSEFGLEVTKCIGTIGLIDMHFDGTGIEKQADGSGSEVLDTVLASFSNDFRKQRYCHILHALNDFLTDSDIETVTTASSVLKQILATKTGMQFVSIYKTRHPNDPLFLYLQPFLSAKKKHVSLPDQKDEFVSVVGDADLWCPGLVNHNTWLRRLVSALINSGGVQDEILRCLNPVCQSQTKFCELVLPFIIHDILALDESQSGQLGYRKTLSDQISCFFQKHCSFHAQKSSHSTEQGGQATNKESVRTLLNVIQYLRLQERSPAATQWHNNFWLEIDYRYLSQAALNCSSYYTSLMYCEVSDLQNGKQSSSATSSGLASSGQVAENIDLQEILLEAYRSISDSDSIYGCAVNQRHMDHLARTKMYEHENNWMKAMTSHDLSISHLSSDSGSLASYAGLVKSLNNLGCDHLLDVYLQGLLERRGREGGGIGGGRDGLCKTGGSRSPIEDDIKEIQYQAASRSCKWDLDIPNRLDDSVCGYSQLVYSSMVGLKQKDGGLVSEGISAARRLLLGSLLNRTGEESESSLYPIISRLQSVSELEDFAQCLVQRSNIMDGILTRWTNQETAILRQEYDDIEPILINRCTMMRLACDDQPHSELMHNGLVQSLVTLVTAARKAGRYQVAGGAMYKLDALSSTSKFPVSYDWKVEEAKLFWAKGEVETAKYLLKNLIDSMERLVNPENSVARLCAQSLVVYGNWLAKTRSESPSIILDKFIRKGTSLLEKNGTCDDEVSVDAFLSFARYADGQYQTIVDYMRSDTFDAKQSLIRQAKDDIDKMKRLEDTASRYFRTLEKQRQIDEDELKRLMSDRERFLIYAVENYIKCLQHHDCHDQYVYRLTSLWFDNMTCQAVNQHIKAGLTVIKSHKFISLMYQLAARMSCRMDGEAGPFQVTLTQLIETVVVDHPHHCLSIILSLANAKRDSEVPKAKTRGRPSMADGSQETEMDEDRVLAAKKMLTRLQKKKGNKIGGIVADMDKLCAAYIQLANWNVDRYKGETKPVNLPDSLLITQIDELPNVAVTTVSVPVDPTCQYKDFTYVAGFQPTFTLAGGINLPKIISCRGSDGVLRRQLVKGKDDLRQDAVMQQVFMMVNDLLKKNPETRKRYLNIRTYKFEGVRSQKNRRHWKSFLTDLKLLKASDQVVPLSQRSGILEWCEGTLPMGEYLIGSTNGAHQRYRPSDLRAMDCRKLLSKAHTDGSDHAKYSTFRQVCSQFHPVFRHFFMERYRHPIDWYRRKLSYTRSVATNSIVGYILGLGDRHVQNILIDTQTAELIHIDLGVAFEQGRILPTPETVPFRLTRDIVDGMGVMGVEGVFRRCCEKTMEVMHSSEEVIITILQVLLYDPLYSWTMSPIKAYQLQSNKTIENDPSVLDTTNMTERRTKGDSQDNVNKVAERVLLRLKQKLQGTEDGVQLSISGQVNHLIQEATDPKNLCRLFPGWQAYI